MISEETREALRRIESEKDASVKALLLAALVSGVFRQAGFAPVIVGGSAIEFYTDGAYMSGDVDICWSGPHLPGPADQARAMIACGAGPGGPRTWKVAGLFVDLLGAVETFATSDYASMDTPLGSVVLQPVEDLIVERVFAARCWTGPNAAAEDCARKLLATALAGGLTVDWLEVERIAALPAYDCIQSVQAMKKEVTAALAEEVP